MWFYSQTTGQLRLDDMEVAVGYAGRNEGKNNPAMQNVKGIGPLPCGTYKIGPRFESEVFGPCCMTLTPIDNPPMFGRGGFLIHGDSKKHPGLGSSGCIVLNRNTRLKIAQSADNTLIVGI